MDALATGRRWDWRRERAWGGLESLLRTHPEGVAAIAVIDRLLEYGLLEREALAFVEELRESGRVAMSNGRWVLL